MTDVARELACWGCLLHLWAAPGHCTAQMVAQMERFIGSTSGGDGSQLATTRVRIKRWQLSGACRQTATQATGRHAAKQCEIHAAGKVCDMMSPCSRHGHVEPNSAHGPAAAERTCAAEVLLSALGFGLLEWTIYQAAGPLLSQEFQHVCRHLSRG